MAVPPLRDWLPTSHQYAAVPNGGAEGGASNLSSPRSRSSSPPSSSSTSKRNMSSSHYLDVLCTRRMRLRVIAPLLFVFAMLFVYVRQNDAMRRMQALWRQQSATGSLNATTMGHHPPPDVVSVDDLVEQHHGPVDWSRFAYTQYVTNSAYLCNSVMLFELLHRLDSRPDRVIMYPQHMFDPDAPGDASDKGNDARLLIKARDEYKVRLVPIQVQSRSMDDATWAESFTKLLAFNQSQYDRVLSLDSDSVVLQHMDELFLLPDCPVAMPRAYWLYPDKEILSSQIMLVKPSAKEFARVMARAEAGTRGDYDMEIVNYLYRDSALVLPHRPYDLLTSEFRSENHSWYLGTDDPAAWDPVAVFNEAKFLHFSDWPVPKPWLPMPESTRDNMQPKCRTVNGVESCVERDMWLGFYSDFTARRNRVCNTASKKRKLRR